jgi:hypothetical protein
MSKMKPVRPRFYCEENFDTAPPTVQELMKFYLARGNKLDKYQVMSLVKPATPLEQILKTFEEHTPTPLQMPLLGFFSLLSAHLMKHDAYLEVKGAKINPDIWTIVLAPSGATKTFSFSQLEKASKAVLNVESSFETPAGAAAYAEEIKEKSGGLWFADEFAQFLGQVEQIGSPLNGCKEYMLKTYDGSEITRKTKGQTIKIENPLLSIYALNTQESFLNKISDESFTDGFSQRFAYLLAKSDPNRSYKQYSIFDVESIQKELMLAFNKIKNVSIHKKYVYTEAAFAAYEEGFRKLLKYDVGESFYRRLMWRSFKYALLFHVANLKDSNEIDVEDVGYSMRMIDVHLDDLQELLSLYNYSELAKKIDFLIEKRKEYRAEGKEYTPRDAVRAHKFKTVDEVKKLLTFVGEIERSEVANV